MIYIASDHDGFELKQNICKFLTLESIEFTDLGPYEFNKPDDYPIFAIEVCKKVLETKTSGILICDTGIGMSIAANRFKGIRAAPCNDSFLALRARKHNDANILVLDAIYDDIEKSKSIILTFINTPFSNEERHIRRVEMLDKLT